MSDNGGLSKSRIPLPNNMKKIIESINEIAKDHSEDDIYAMLKECSMDPNETIQRLLHLDTFQQVRNKRDKRKEVLKNRLDEDSRRKPGPQVQATRVARGNYYTQYSSHDARGPRNNSFWKENEVQETGEKGFRNSSAPVPKERDAVQPCHLAKASYISIVRSAKIPNGNLNREHDSIPYRTGGEDSLLTIRPKPNAEQTPCASEPVLIPSGNSCLPSSNSTITPSSLQGAGLLAGAKEAASKFVKPKFSNGQQVIIPDHIRVPDAVKDALRFGSINAGFRVEGNCVTVKESKNLHSTSDEGPVEAIGNLSLWDKDAVSTVTQADHSDNQQPQSHLPEKKPAMDNQLKENNLPAVGAPSPIVLTTPSLTFGCIPPLLAKLLQQPTGFENHAHFSSYLSENPPTASTSASTAPLAQPAVVGQPSVTVPPNSISFFHQPHTSNYIPYAHYFSPLYVHPTMHQYYGLPGFSAPAPTGNVFLPTPIATQPMTHSPPHIKPGANAGNQMLRGEPSTVKDKNVSSRKQSEGTGVWLPTTRSSQDTTSFPYNGLLNCPNGGFPVYLTSQPMATPSPSLTPFQLSQPVTGQVESVGSPSNAHQQLKRQHPAPMNRNAEVVG